jgi:anaerobic selenocysteine-containing dehydrogenase
MAQLQITRRDFLKLAAAATAATATASLPVVGRDIRRRKLAVLAAEFKAKPANVRYVPSICRMCTAACSIIVRVRNGKPERILGNPKATLLNEGRICARGNMGVLRAYHPDRLLRPLIRTGGRRGEWRFREASWDEAIRAVASKLRELRAKGETHKVILVIGQIGCATYHHHVVALAKTLGTPNIISMPLSTCVLPKAIAWGVTGLAGKHTELVPDYQRTRFFLSFARNLGGAVAVGQTVKAAKARRGYKLVVLDPRLSEWAAKADEWIPIRPGTDLAFLLAMINVIIEKGLYDADYLAKYTNAPMIIAGDSLAPVKTRKIKKNIAGKTVELVDFLVYDEAAGEFRWASEAQKPALTLPEKARVYEGKRVRTVFEALRDHVKSYTPQWASKITGVPAETIERIAVEFATTKPAAVETGWNTNRWWNSFQLYRAAAVLAALTGNLLRPGGVVLSAAGIKSVLARAGAPVASEKSILLKLEKNLEITLSDGTKVKGPLLPLGHAYGEPPEGMKREKGWVIIVIGANPARTMVGNIFEKWAQLPTVDMVVDIGLMKDDTVAYSDVVIPECAYTERSYTITGAPFTLGKMVRAAFAAHKPPEGAQCKNMMEILLDILSAIDPSLAEKYAEHLAEELGSAKCADRFREAVKAYLSERSWDGFTSRVLRAQAECMGIPLEKLERDGVIELADESWGLEMNRRILENGWLNSPTGKIEILPLKILGLMMERGFPLKPEWHPFPTWVPPKWMWKGSLAQDEFAVITGKVPTMSYTSTADNPMLTLKLSNPEMKMVWINSERAKRLGIKTGDLVEVCGASGCFKARVWVTEAIHPDAIYIPPHYGQEIRGRYNDVEVPAINKLGPFIAEPVAGSRIMADFVVKVRKV